MRFFTCVLTFLLLTLMITESGAFLQPSLSGFHMPSSLKRTRQLSPLSTHFFSSKGFGQPSKNVAMSSAQHMYKPTDHKRHESTSNALIAANILSFIATFNVPRLKQQLMKSDHDIS